VLERLKGWLNNVVLIMALGTVALLSAGCRSVSNYMAPQSPRFEGSYAGEQPLFDGTLQVVSWNIAFAEDIDQAIAELESTEELQAADIYLLQEMDEDGTEAIARALETNYVYYPASVHSHNEKDFGNAVLSKWPIADSEKLILPHQNPRNEQIRIAVKAELAVGDLIIPVYSVHTETFWLGPDGRMDQFDSLAQDAESGEPYLIVGGDFNTLTPTSVGALERRFEEQEMKRVSAAAGPTVGLGGVGLTLDHVFARGMTVLDAGVVSKASASDHDPLWVNLSLD